MAQGAAGARSAQITAARAHTQAVHARETALGRHHTVTLDACYRAAEVMKLDQLQPANEYVGGSGGGGATLHVSPQWFGHGVGAAAHAVCAACSKQAHGRTTPAALRAQMTKALDGRQAVLGPDHEVGWGPAGGPSTGCWDARLGCRGGV